MRGKKVKKLRKVVRPIWDVAKGEKLNFKSVMRRIRRAITRGEVTEKEITRKEVKNNEKRRTSKHKRSR